MDRDDVTSAGVAAIGMVAGTVVRAVALGGKLVAAGLGTLEQVLRGRDADDAPPEAPAARSGFAPLSEPAFEPADGVTAAARPARTVTRRSSAGAAARTAPNPRPAKRATSKTLPPNLRPVAPREPAPAPAPVKGAAGAADVAGVEPVAAKKAAAKKTATKAPATKAAPKKAAATKGTAAKAAAVKGTDGTPTVPKAAAKKSTGKKAAAPAADTQGASGGPVPADPS